MKKSVLSRFKEKYKINPNTGCWEWVSSLTKKGYGDFHYEGRTRLAHRVAMELYLNINPGELHVCHSCDNPRCVNPKHLFLGTNHDNHKDMKQKGRQARGTRLPQAKLTEKQVREIRAALQRGTLSQKEIGNLFGVHQVTINDINLNKSWRHI